MFALQRGYFFRVISLMTNTWEKLLQQFPGWWLWYYWICPLSWTLNGLMTSQYGDLRKKISVEGKPQQAIEDFLKDYFGFQRDFLDVVAAVLAIFPVLFALSFCISINILNFQKR